MVKPEILYEDRDLVVVKKPTGTDSQESRGSGQDMVSILKNYRISTELSTQGGGKEGVPYIAVVHRHQIVALMGEGAENGFADFPAADDDNFHRTNTSMIDNSSGLRPGQSRDPLLAGFKAVDPVGFQVVDQIDQ